MIIDGNIGTKWTPTIVRHQELDMGIFGVPMAALFQVVMFIDVKIMQDLFGADIDTFGSR